MATLTIRNVPDDVVARPKGAAEHNRRSMEQEVRELLVQRYPDRDRLLDRIRERWNRFPAPRAAQIDEWIETGRK
jgi:plasmid stability protein